MRYDIYINKQELLQQVDLRTHYHAEVGKRTDLNADTGESSADDTELMDMFLHKACNELVAPQIARFDNIEYRIDEHGIYIIFESRHNVSELKLPILKQSIIDFLVNELMTQWLMIRNRSWSDTYIAMRNELFDKAQRMFDLFSFKKIRSRPTDFAGL
ncbi:MAG: hypothetical protein IKU35_00935 [Bacteroidaceae bacterium]|nr:hypothetical protein [Bacteroidaceae bacterium]